MQTPVAKKLSMAIAVLLAGTVTSACSSETTHSEAKHLESAMQLGHVTMKNKEVLVYYANETRPDAAEQENYDYIIGLMKRSDKPLVKHAAEKIEQDPAGFSGAVDQDIAELESHLCKNKNNHNFHVVVFDNGHSRQGKYRYCAPGTGLKTADSNELKLVYEQIVEKKDFRLHSSPQASKEMFAAAIKIVKTRYQPSDYSYSLVTKSHGSGEKMLGVRLSIRGDLIKARENGEEEFLTALEDMAAKKEEALNKALVYREDMQTRIIKAIESLPDNHKLKDSILKDAILKDSILKDALLKDAILKDSILKDAILKDAILKDAILKDAILKDAILKDGILKDAILKDGLLKDGLLKDALLKDGILGADESGIGILEATSRPSIGISKRDALEVIASFDSEDRSQRMEFVTLFAESCESYLTWDITMDIADSGWNPNVGTIFTSDERGLDTYRTIEYEKFLKSLIFSQSLSKQMNSHLAKLSEEQKTKGSR